MLNGGKIDGQSKTNSVKGLYADKYQKVSLKIAIRKQIYKLRTKFQHKYT